MSDFTPVGKAVQELNVHATDCRTCRDGRYCEPREDLYHAYISAIAKEESRAR